MWYSGRSMSAMRAWSSVAGIVDGTERGFLDMTSDTGTMSRRFASYSWRTRSPRRASFPVITVSFPRRKMATASATTHPMTRARNTLIVWGYAPTW